MFRDLIVLNSDTINRKRIKFTVGALEDAIFKNSLEGIPYLVGHDGLRPIGWIFPFGLYFEPGLTRMLGEHQVAETDEDQAKITKAYKSTLAHRYRDECEPHRSELEALIKDHQTPEGRYIGLGCAAYVDCNILRRVYPFLKSLEDKDGLLSINDLLTRFEYLGQGVFRDKDQNLSIFCHSYFRRSLSHINNFNFDFIESFMRLTQEPGVKLRLALDYNAIGLASSYHMREELEYVWGPNYSDDISSIRMGVSYFQCDDRQKFFSRVSGTEFWWKKDEQLRILEAEELRDNPTSSAELYGCRYIHSIYDTEQNTFAHFDGAIRMYSTEEMIARLGQQMNKAGKNTEYTKLFRIDGQLKLYQWKSLITFYFAGNPLVYEYFGMKQEHDKLYETNSPHNQEPLIERYVPYRIDNNAGVRLFLSYHELSKTHGNVDRIVINPDSFVQDSGKINVIDFYALEIKKALNRIGEDLTIPQDLKFVSALDNYINFPMILHGTINAHDKLIGTLTAYILLFEGLKNWNPTISLNLAWPLNEKEVRLSVFGKVSEVNNWLLSNKNIPFEYSEFRKWVEEQNVWLSKTFKAAPNKPDLFNLVSGDGVIFIRRKIVHPNWINFKEGEKGLEYELTIPKEHDDLLNALKNQILSVAVFYIVEKAICSKTGEDYFLSGTSKVLDSDVSATIMEAGSLAACWTAPN